MPGWNGAGVFVLPYSMIAEAASGVKILASHQDTQWNAIKAGLENCLTRDGQNALSSDMNAGSHRLSVVADPLVPTDAATKNYVDTSTGEWLLESYLVQWISATSFQVVTANVTAKYHVGRRVKIIHTAGAVAVYGTVTAVSFAAGNTLVTVTMDAGTALVAPVTSAYAGEQSYTNTSYLDPRTAVMAYVGTGYTTAAGPVTILFNTTTVDSNSEFSTGTGKFTCRYPGVYQISGQILARNSSAVLSIMQYRVLKNGVTSLFFGQVMYEPTDEGTNQKPLPIPPIVATLAKADTIEVQMFNALTFDIAGAVNGPLTYLSIVRIP